MTDMNCLKERVEKLSKFHQIEILKILKKDDNTTINENNNGIFINMTNLNSLEKNSLDIYAAYKSLYLQNRESKINNTFTTDGEDDWAEFNK